MSERRVTTELEDIAREKKILEAVLAYYVEKKPFDEISKNIKLSFNDFNRYLSTNRYPQRITADIDEIKARVRNRLNELDKQARSAKPDAVGNLKQLFFIPSWRKLIETDFRGFYLNQPVLDITQDSVVILPEIVLTSLENTLGEPFLLIMGPGIYYVKFSLSPGEIITDYREITGVVLLLDIYEKAQDAPPLIESSKFLMTEYLISIPFSLFLARQTTQMFLRGVIARNVVHPNKECFDQLLEICRNPRSFSEDEGFKVLSGGLSSKIPIYTNELLTEFPLKGNYSKLTAGIKNIQPKLEKILTDLQIKDMKSDIFEKIRLLKKDFVNIGHPKLLDWVP
ncbi:MAG: hypothetical protein ACFFDI_07185 [Promethearchaeota archaeon]